MKNSGISKFVLVYDGSFYFNKKNKLTYVKLVKDELEFFNKIKVNATDITTSDVVIEGLYERLLASIRNLDFFGESSGIQLKNTYDISEDVNIDINSNLEYLIIKSPLYTIVETAVKESSNGLSYTDPHGAFTIDAITMNRLKVLFTQRSMENYKYFLNTTISRKIVGGTVMKRSFFNIRKAFVPAIVSIEGIYNPLLDNKDNSVFFNSLFYKTVMETNAVVESPGSFKIYLLSHLQICKCLHMENFLRFTPLFLYLVICGLLDPSNPAFPNNNNFVMCSTITNKKELPRSLKYSYSMEDFAATYKKWEDKIQEIKNEESTDMDALEKAEVILRILSNYKRSTSMKVFCRAEYDHMTNFGRLPIDNSVSLDDRVTYLLPISL
jgi:hypothetical protein